ncbi:precorrin-2/cobalt-factor-2 C20-methyltransferase [Lachnospiraceae bacterium]|nr:precorrin-2/cobalt-factor-2 C20-methyltransferase [Lachnospiraceae bacterium]
MNGIAYGVGIGPGDPELLTLKAVRMIKECDVVAVAGKDPKESFAYRIASAAVPEIADKELVGVYMPMVKDREKLREEHEKGAKLLESYLEQGKNIAYITLGDPTIYCTFSYLQHILERDGFEVKLISGITSFCAAAARLNISLAEWDEELHIVPAVHKEEHTLDYDGNYVLMKSASHMSEVKEILRESGLTVNAVENCGCDNEKVYRGIDEIPDDAGYYSLIVAKRGRS